VIRDPRRLADDSFDLLVVGGGIYGAWIACDAARRGLRTALVERRDWAAGTSSASSKLIHGGLRYLETMRLHLVRHARKERARLARLAPHRVRSLEFLAPIYDGGRLGGLRMRAGLTIYDWLAGRSPSMPPHRRLAAAEVLRRAPYLARGGLRSGFLYSDGQTDDARLTLDVVAAAAAAGAACVNHATALEWRSAAGRISGALVRDAETERTIEVKARLCVDATGPWSGLLPGGPAAGARRLTRGVHLVLPALPGRDAVLFTAPQDGRVMFLLPWYGRTLVGTTDTDESGDPDATRVTDRDREYLLTAANRMLGDMRWERGSILAESLGLRVFPPGRVGEPSALSREWAFEATAPGLMRSIGGKLTSARADAARLVDRILPALQRDAAPCATADTPLPSAPTGSFESWYVEALTAAAGAGLDSECAGAAAVRHGAHLPVLLDLVRQDPRLAWRLHPELPFCRAEVIMAVRHEMARTLEDVLRRRVPILLLATWRPKTADAVLELAAHELGWSDARRQSEQEQLQRLWRGTAADGA